MFCLDCKLRLNKCPVCSKAFKIEAPAAFKRVLELLPQFCRYKGCSEFSDDVTRLKEHETWCGHRPTQCKFCRWSEQAKELYKHCSQKHYDLIFEIRSIASCIPYPPKYEACKWLVIAYHQIFWVTIGIDQSIAFVYAQIIWVPDGSVNKNLFEAQVNFQVGSSMTSMTKPIIHQESTNASESYLFKVPLSTLTSSKVGQSIRIRLVIVKK